MTALAAGAGPPAKRIATRFRLVDFFDGADKGLDIDFPITRQDIADMTGTTLHTVSRVLSAWEDQGLVSGGRQKVRITDPHGLMLIAENRRRT